MMTPVIPAGKCGKVLFLPRGSDSEAKDVEATMWKTGFFFFPYAAQCVKACTDGRQATVCMCAWHCWFIFEWLLHKRNVLFLYISYLFLWSWRRVFGANGRGKCWVRWKMGRPTWSQESRRWLLFSKQLRTSSYLLFFFHKQNYL